MRRLVRGIVVVVAAVVWLAAPSAARAGTVKVQQCHGREGSNSMLGNWWSGPTAQVHGWCAAGFGWLVLQNAASSGTLNSGDIASVDIAAPANTSILDGTIQRRIVNYTYMTGGLDTWALGYRLGDPAGGAPIERCGTMRESPGDCVPTAAFEPDRFPNPAVAFTRPVGSGPRSLRVAFGCFPAPPESGNGCRVWHPNPGIEIGLIQLTLHDGEFPTATPSGPLWHDPVVTDPVITIDATDRGLGVLDATVIVGNTKHSVDVGGSACTESVPVFDAANVCPLATGPLSIRVPNLPEGRHRVAVQLRDLSLNETTLTRPTTATIDVVPPPQPGEGAARPFVSGSVREGGTLTANPGSWNTYGREIEFLYQWQRCAADGGGCLDIAGATGQRYTPGSLDLGALLRVSVTGALEGDPEDARTVNTATVGPVVGLQCFGARCEVVTVDEDKPQESQPPANGDGATARARVTAGYGDKRVVRMGYGQRLMLRGRLADERGGAISGAKLDVLARAGSVGAQFSPIGQVTTAADGSFAYLTPVGASRVIRFAYRALHADLEYASAADVDLIVRARVSFRATKRVRAGQPVRLRGSVAGIRPGTRLEIQARDRRVWRTFKTVRTRRDGSFATSYTFKRVPGPLSYLFRVVYRKNPSVPLESARSKALRVKVRP